MKLALMHVTCTKERCPSPRHLVNLRHDADTIHQNVLHALPNFKFLATTLDSRQASDMRQTLKSSGLQH